MLLITLVLSVAQGGCFWKLWSKPKAPGEKVFDVYGNVESVDPDRIVIRSRKGGIETFIMGPASIKGGDFEQGDLVHVYYKQVEQGKIVTMVVEKIK
jgi:hypothetical protein